MARANQSDGQETALVPSKRKTASKVTREMMYGGRGFLSTNRSTSNGDPPRNVATRARPTGASTQLRQKPAAPAANQQDFFASLGVDTTLRDRTSINSSSTSYGSMTIGSVSASGVYSSTPTSSSSGWRPPPIVGLGSARTTPPSPPVPAIGSLKITSVDRSVRTTTSSTSSTTMSLYGGVASVSTGITAAATNAGKPSTRPTQLFSMEDAEDLYSDDGWNCDSPSTVLSNPLDETETTSLTEPGKAAVAIDAEKANNKVAWGKDDDEFTSSVAKLTTPSSKDRTGNDFLETKTETIYKAGSKTEFTTESCLNNQEQSRGTKSPFADAQPNSKAASLANKTVTSVSNAATHNVFDATSYGATQDTAFEHTQVKSPQSLPPVNLQSTFLSTSSPSNAFKTPNHDSSRQQGSFVERPNFDEPYKQNKQWDDVYDGQKKPFDAGSEVLKTVDSTTMQAATYSTTTTTHTMETLAAPPVELTSPGGAAGEFWGDEDEDDLFKNDDNTEDEWNRSLTLSSSDKKDKVDSTTTPSSFDISFSYPHQSSSPYSGIASADQKDVSTMAQVSNHFTPGDSKNVDNQEKTHQSLREDTQASVSTPSPVLNTDTGAEVLDSAMPMHPVGSSQLEKPQGLCAESPFSSAIAESADRDNNVNVFPEAPRSGRFLHTPTGTGGPFGRVRSPDCNNKFEDRPAAVADKAGHGLMTFACEAKREVSDSFAQPSVKWDSGDHGPVSTGEQANAGYNDPHHNTHNKQGDEEERGSVVSFSGENSFFQSAGRPSSLYGGSQSSFASHRMYQSSIASTDHDGSSIASFGVSSAGATFGGSERVSEGGAFSDGTVSETPSMVDSSNASTTFGTDYPSVSEGQFSAPGTTIGGSDNASDGGFSDDNVSEATSICESVNPNPRFVSEFSASSGHYVTEEVEHADMPQSPDSVSVATFEEDAPAAAAPIFGAHDTSADAKPLASSQMLFSSSQHASGTPAATASVDTCFEQSEGAVQVEQIQSASLFGTTAGVDVPNPFDSNSASIATNDARQIGEHELPTRDTGDLFGSSSFTNGFQSSFTRPTITSSSMYQTHNETYNQVESGSQISADSLRTQFTHTNVQAGGMQIANRFDTAGSSNYDRVDTFASRDVQLNLKKSIPSAESIFNNGGCYNGKLTVDHGNSSQLDGDIQAGTNSRLNTISSTASSHFKQQPQSSAHNVLHGENQSFNYYAQNSTATHSDQVKLGALDDGFHPSESASAHARALTHSQEQSSGSEAAESAMVSSSFENYSHQSPSTSNTAQHEIGGFEGQKNLFGRSACGIPDNYKQQSAFEVFASASLTSQPYETQVIGRRSTTPETPNDYDHPSTAGAVGGVSPARPSYTDHQGDSYSLSKHAVPDPAEPFGGHSQSAFAASTDAFIGRPSAAYPSSMAFDVGGRGVVSPSSVSHSQQPPVQQSFEVSFTRSGSTASMKAEQHSDHLAVTSTVMRPSLQLHDLDTSNSTVEDANLSRQTSISSISQCGVDTSFQSQQDVYGYDKRVDENLLFGEMPYTELSTTFSQNSSLIQSSHSPVTAFEEDNMRRVPPQNVSPPRPDHEKRLEESVAQSSRFKFGGEYSEAPNTAVSAPAVEPSSSAEVDVTTENSSVIRGESLQQSVASVATVENSISPSANRAQTLQSIPVSDPHALFGGATSSDFFSSSSAPQTDQTLTSYQFEQREHIQETQNHQVPIAQEYFPDRKGGARIPDENSDGNCTSDAPRAVNPGSDSFSRQQWLPQQRPYQAQQKYGQSAGLAYGYQGGFANAQIQRAGFHGADQCGNGVEYGDYGQTKRQQTPHATPARIVMTSDKYKDPCAAPPSCLATFGFGGNVVTMFPKKKLRLNIAGTNFRNSPQRSSASYDINHGDGEIRKGPVNMYRMEQLHPNDNDFEEMDIFPGPLTEDVTGETILEFLDHRLKRSEATANADEADEDERLLLGVLHVLVKCNGKLRSDPGTLNPSDPNSPEAQLIALLRESSTRRNLNQPLNFPAPRRIQSETHPDVVLKHANDLRELLFAGDRKGAISTAMTAHMWPEAMLIASFTDKEEYQRVLRTYLDEHYVTGDPFRALFMSFANQQEKSVHEPKRLLQTNAQQPTGSPILSTWVSHVQILLSNRTADTNTILTELGDRLWSEVNAVAAAHVCYLLANVRVDAPTPTSKLALLGGDHRTPKEARFYVSPGAVQRTEIYEWAQKQANGASGNLMIPFQGYKLIYAMLLADHGKLDTAFKYVTSMLKVIKIVMATMKPGTSMYLEGMKTQLTVLDDRLRQHLGQARIASVAASTDRSGNRKQGGKWGLGNALSIMGKIVNRVVEGNESGTDAAAAPNASSPGDLYANEATASATDYARAMQASTSSPAQSYPQQHVQPTPPPSSQELSPGRPDFYGHATPPVSHTNALSYKRASPTPVPNVGPSAPSMDDNQRLAPSCSQNQQQPACGPFSGNGRPGTVGSMANNWSDLRESNAMVRSQNPIEPPGSNRSTNSNHSFHGRTPPSTSQYPPQPQQQPPSSQTPQPSQGFPAFPTSSSPAKSAETLRSTDTSSRSDPASDQGQGSPKLQNVKKPERSKTPPPSNSSSKSSGWLSGLSSFLATKMNPEAKVAKLGEQMEAYFDEDAKRWVFPGETAHEEARPPSVPPIGPLPSSAPGSCATGVPPKGSISAPGSISSGTTPSTDPLAALMAPPPSHLLMKKDPLAAMMAPPSRPAMYGARPGGVTAQRKPPRPQFAVFKPTAVSSDKQSEH